MPSEEQKVAVQKLYADALADKGHEIHSLDAEVAARGAEKLMLGVQEILGVEADLVHDSFGGGSAPPSTGTTPTESPVFRSAHAAQSAAAQAGLNAAEFQQFVAEEGRYPAGAFNEESMLDGLNPVERDRARRLHARGLRRLPLSVRVHLETRGTHYSPKVFNRLVALGQELEELDAAINAEAARNPGSKRLRELVTRRDGPGHTIVAF